ncbi:MAG: fatty acid cis/trans isomerase, partial [bacterium]
MRELGFVTGISRLLVIVGLLLAAACVKDASVTTELMQEATDKLVLDSMPGQPVSYDQQVKPILEQRCVVCHGCYDAPCQLKLSSVEGIERGGSKQKVYNGARILTAEPTRLFVDAQSTEEWREKGFHSVLNEHSKLPGENLAGSALYRMLRLKQLNPLPDSERVPDSIDLSLDRKQSCPTTEEMSDYEVSFPQQGMPFAMPGLSRDEFTTLSHWIAQGSPIDTVRQLSAASQSQVDDWEFFLNQPGLKAQLMSRYLYEHLFQGHLHFEGADSREFYRLIRSYTPPGERPHEIATVRPYGDPGGRFFYRLVPYLPSIVAKDHVVYELSPGRMERYTELFLKLDYEVNEYPSWEPTIASNPFKSFAAIPPESRYRFLLDDARFFVEGFIKGPVCRGQIALNVIEDNFWVVFVEPDIYDKVDLGGFLNAMADYLEVPSAQEGEIGLLSAKREYKKLQKIYNDARLRQFAALDPIDLGDSMNLIWDGEGNNPNAALSIFRHFDSASVAYGFVGDYPETAWIIDYPLLERIHYLLVAGFNVYGNLKHQLNTRLYMDYLRMQGEDNFLSFIPSGKRESIRRSWYQGMREGMESEVMDSSRYLEVDVVTGYQSDDPQHELYRNLEAKMAPVAMREDQLNRCNSQQCEENHSVSLERRIDNAMRRLGTTRGVPTQYFSDVAFVRVVTEGGPDMTYTVIQNKAYKNVTSMFSNEKHDSRRDTSNDTITVLD